MILFKYKKIISFLVASILVLSFYVCAYADDPDGSYDSEPSSDRPATVEELQELDSAISETSHNLALLMASGDPVRATDYEQATYNLLSSVFGSSSSSWASIIATRLGYLSTINTSANSLVVKLTGFYNSINPDYDTTGISMYDLGHGILTALTSVDPNDGDLTIIETLVYITSALDDLDTDLTAILNSTYSIDNKLVSINTAIVQFKSDLLTSISTLNTDINNGFTNVNANMALILSRLQSMQNDFNNISWLSLGSSSLYYSDGSVISSNGNLSQNLIYSNIPYFDSYISMIKVDIALSGNSTVNRNNNIIDVYITDNNNLKLTVNYYVVYDLNRSHTVIYIYDYGGTSNSSSNLFKLFVQTRYTSYYNASRGVQYSYITFDTADYINIYNWLINRSNHQIMDRLKLLYASDDLIEAKKDQQTYEDTAIEDFTGSGSASASVSDLGGLKSVSSAFKSGLDSGGSVSNALSIFSNNSGFWGWFSQSNYNDINNLSNSGSNTRSRNNIQEDIIDYYSDNMFNLMYLLQNAGD